MKNINQKNILVLICTLTLLFLGFNIEVNAQNDALHISKDGNVGIGTTKPTKQLEIVGDINATETCTAKTFKATETCTAKTFKGYGTIPIGGIIMWSGTDIPDGWALCNGKSYDNLKTPNLTDKFIVGAGSSYKINDTGGEKKVKLTLAEMPEHSHHYTKGVAKTHGDLKGGSGHKKQDITVSFNDNNTKSIGSGESHENRPPYYALAFIMRVQ